MPTKDPLAEVDINYLKYSLVVLVRVSNVFRHNSYDNDKLKMRLRSFISSDGGVVSEQMVFDYVTASNMVCCNCLLVSSLIL